MAFGPEGPPEATGAGLLSSLSDSLATPEESRLLDALRRELADELRDTPGHPDVVGDLRLLRTLRGFDHCLAEAADAFRAHLAVRQSHGLDEIRARILERWGSCLWELRAEMLPHGDTICRYMPEVLLFARTRAGDAVSLGLWGRGRPAAFVTEVEGWQDKFLEFYLYMNEARMLLLDQASREDGRLAHFIQIFDLDEWSIMGNADHAWSSFTSERAGPVGETYHDCNVKFLALRTTRMARMAYNMIKRWWPRKVTEKVHIYGDDFCTDRYLQSLLGGQTLELLRRRAYTPTARCREGCATVKPRQKFELEMDVPLGGRVRWKFSVRQEQGSRHCLLASLPWACAELEFSCFRAGEQTALPGGEPRRIGAEGVAASVAGCLEVLEAGEAGTGFGGRSVIALRWDNSRALLTSKDVRYRVEVEDPSCANDQVLLTQTELDRPSKEGRSTLWFTLNMLIVVVLVFLARMLTHIEET